MTLTGWFVAAGTLLALIADVALALAGFATISTTVAAWGLRATIVPLLAGALGGHIFHDLVPSLHFKPLPAHVAFFACLMIFGIWSQMMHLPRELLAIAGWVIAALLVPA